MVLPLCTCCSKPCLHHISPQMGGRGGNAAHWCEGQGAWGGCWPSGCTARGRFGRIWVIVWVSARGVFRVRVWVSARGAHRDKCRMPACVTVPASRTTQLSSALTLRELLRCERTFRALWVPARAPVRALVWVSARALVWVSARVACRGDLRVLGF